jgi:hypothetical protein
VRLDQLWFGVLVGASVLLLAGCGSGALTTQPSVNPQEQTTAPATMLPSDAFTAAVTKLRLIAQDSCQTAPADQIYPNCDRFLAELRSAAGTIQNDSPGLPGGASMARIGAGILASAGAFDKDGCGSGPYAAGPRAAPACVADLTRVRQGLTALLNQTAGSVGAGG